LDQVVERLAAVGEPSCNSPDERKRGLDQPTSRSAIPRMSCCEQLPNSKVAEPLRAER
jgi:hypothetical protein